MKDSRLVPYGGIIRIRLKGLAGDGHLSPADAVPAVRLPYAALLFIPRL